MSIVMPKFHLCGLLQGRTCHAICGTAEPASNILYIRGVVSGFSLSGRHLLSGCLCRMPRFWSSFCLSPTGMSEEMYGRHGCCNFFACKYSSYWGIRVVILPVHKISPGPRREMKKTTRVILFLLLRVNKCCTLLLYYYQGTNKSFALHTSVQCYRSYLTC